MPATIFGTTARVVDMPSIQNTAESQREAGSSYFTPLEVVAAMPESAVFELFL